MATQAYVFVYATPGKTDAGARVIARLTGVKSAHACWGRQDVIAFVEVPNLKALGHLMLRRIQRVWGAEARDTRISSSRVERSAMCEETEFETLQTSSETRATHARASGISRIRRSASMPRRRC